MAIDIVDSPIKDGGSFHSYVSIFPNIWGYCVEGWDSWFTIIFRHKLGVLRIFQTPFCIPTSVPIDHNPWRLMKKPVYQRRFTWKSNRELSINGSCQFIPICWVSDLLLSHFACCQFLFRFMSHVFNVCGTPSVHVSSFFLPPFILDT